MSPAAPGTDQLQITLPAGLNADNDTLILRILTDSKGNRVMERNLRDANASDAGRRRRVQWEIWGPIGRSLESTSGGMGIDFARNLETRWERQLTSSIAQTLLDLTGDDPPGIDGSYYCAHYYGTKYYGSPLGSGSSGNGPDVVCFAEQNGYLLVGRGALLTSVRLSDWTVIETIVLDAPVLDMDHWFGNVYIAQGSTVPMQRVVGVSDVGIVVEDVIATTPAEAVYASAIKRGSDRMWYVNANQGQATYNFMGYTLDAFENLAFPFQVGDPMAGSTGIGPFGSLTAHGEVDAVYTFTDQGKGVQLSKALDAIHSTLNGKIFADPGFGWNYYTSIAAMRAHTFSGVDNPVGIGERMRGFTGHAGLATAVYAARGELWVVYHTTDGRLYGYRGQFGSETGGTGQPLLFPWFSIADEVCNAIFSSTTPNAPIETTQQLTIIRAQDTNLTHMAVAASGMDNLSAVTYSTAGGSAYLTTLDRSPNLLKTLRLIRTRAQSMTSGDEWTFSMAFDANPNKPTTATYVEIGSLTTNGESTILPLDTNGDPLTNISGFTMKPLIEQTAAGSGASTTPPTLVGQFEAEYDERPEQVEELGVQVVLDGPQYDDNQIWKLIQDLVGSNTDGPFKLQIPDNPTPEVDTDSGGGTYWAMLNSATKRTDASQDVEAVQLVFSCWPQAAAL